MNLHGYGGDDPGDVERGERPQPGEALAPACGERVRISTLKAHQYCLLCCCPCFLGPACSSNRRTNYLNMMKTLSFMIFVVCVIMMLVEIGMGGVQSWSDNPMLGPDAYTLAKLGSSYGYRIKYKGEVYRFFSPIFLHGGLLHILMNMLFLAFVGVPLEQKWGWKLFGAIFFLSGIGASLFSTTIHPNTISVGASGALFGLLGASLADTLTHWATLDPQMRKMQLIQQIVLIVVWMFISFGVKYIDGWAHLGGLIFGFTIGAMFWMPETELRPLFKEYGRPAFLALNIVFVLILGGVFAFVVKPLQIFPDY